MVAKDKRAFTLLELIIVLTLISLTLGIVGINIQGARKKQLFLTEVDRILSNMRLAQDLMLIEDSDLTIYFVNDEKGDGINHWVEIDREDQDTWKKIINQTEVKLYGIKEITFNDQTSQEGVLIRFNSGGFLMSRGLLKFTNEKETRTLPLFGYPRPLNIQNIEELPSEEMADQELTRQMIEEMENER